MAGKRVGTIFIELDLDPTRYMKGQKTLLKEATQGASRLEKNFKNLRIKSDANYDLMRAHAITAYRTIRANAKSTANDIVRAEKAKAAQLKYIQEKQFGVQKSLLTKMKENWLAVTAAIIVAWRAAQRVFGAVSGVVMAAARYETLGVVMRVVGNNAGFTSEKMAEFQAGLEKTGIAMTESRQVLTVMNQAQIDLNKSTALGRIAQDAAVIGNINSSEAMKSLIHGIHTANVRVLRTIGIQVSWEQSYKKVAAEMGRTTASLTLLEKAQIRVGAVLEAGERIAGSYEAAMETAGKQTLSLQRHFDNLKVLAGAAFTPALLEIVQGITGSIKGMNEELSGESKEAISDWGANFRLTIIDISAEIMRVALLLDKIGGSATQIKALLYLPGTALGFESSTARFNATIKQNEVYAARYAATEKAIMALALKRMAIEKSLTAQGKAAAKAKLDALEKERLAATATSKALKESQKDEVAAAQKTTALQKKLDAGRKRALIKQAKGIKDIWQLRIKTDKDATDRAIAALSEEIREYDGFFGGIRRGYDDLEKHQNSWADHGANTVWQFAQTAESSMADFINPLKDDFLDLANLWDNMLNSMVGSFTRAIADMATQQLMKSVFGGAIGGIGGTGGSGIAGSIAQSAAGKYIAGQAGSLFGGGAASAGTVTMGGANVSGLAAAQAGSSGGGAAAGGIGLGGTLAAAGVVYGAYQTYQAMGRDSVGQSTLIRGALGLPMGGLASDLKEWLPGVTPDMLRQEYLTGTEKYGMYPKFKDYIDASYATSPLSGYVDKSSDSYQGPDRFAGVSDSDIPSGEVHVHFNIDGTEVGYAIVGNDGAVEQIEYALDKRAGREYA